MTTPQPDKTGMHILLKLASLVVILAGIHAAADIIVQLLLALFFAIVLNPLVTWFIRLMRSAINEGQKARYLESKNVSIYESELQKKHPF
ncbi:AI-2 transport protein TqsA [Klebsiella michiganensis]|nr:AI-2 transport protein TqsA [Klebsiella michiganensis]